jgi:hypothetical protein
LVLIQKIKRTNLSRMLTKNNAIGIQWRCLSLCGLLGTTIEHLIPILTFFDNIK